MVVWLRYLPALLLIGTLGAGYVMWTNMEKTIARQQVEIANKQKTIDVLANNIVEFEKEAASERDRAVFDALVEDRKKLIEDGLIRDRSSLMDINSTRFYL